MNHFITNIHVNKLFHLNNFDIPIADEKYPHLIITGKNGSGKTILLNAIAEFFNIIKEEKTMSFLNYKSQLSYWKSRLNLSSDRERMQAKKQVDYYLKKIDDLWGKVDIELSNASSIIEKYNEGDFILSFYQASRIVSMIEPKNPTKPNYNKKGNVRETATSQFLNFLSDLKIQEALARNEKLFDEADNIGVWFVDFENLLSEIYQDSNLKIEFNYKDYSFHILTEGKRFKFTEVSEGFSAILDIVADLILKMQGEGLTKNYQKEGIVLIDEIETHLHLGLQKSILPFLTKIFPNIQFIVTTHSPFVLNSIPNAVAYDLEHSEILNDLTEYSYESLAEGYFGVKTPSSYVEMQLGNLRALLEKKDWSDSDKQQIRRLISDFDNIPEAISPLIVGEFQQLAVEYANKLKELQK